MRLIPVTAADSYYAIGEKNPVSMALLQNLVPAPDSNYQWVCRPAATQLPGSVNADFGQICALTVIGNRAYGMVKSLSAFSGKDIPFCYDLLGGAYISITGPAAGNLPTSAPTTGDWVPPHLELVGTKLICTHSGFSGTGANFFGVIDTTNPSALTWTSANTATNLLPSAPVWCSQFFQRAYYFCTPANAQPSAIASDSLNATTITNPSYILTFDDNIPLLCGGTLGLDTQLGGKVASLIVFKRGAAQMYQVTGDFAATSTNGIPFLQVNNFSVGIGTFAPNSVCKTPKGLIFVAPDGMRVVDFDAHVSDPIGYAGTGITVPYVSSVTASRIAANCDGSTIRTSTQNGAMSGTPQQDWCFDIVRGVWHGPHTFPIALMAIYNRQFVIAPIGIPGLWISSITPNSSSTYVENGASYSCVYQSALMPDRDTLSQLSTSKAVFYQGYGSSAVTYNISALDANGNIINYTSLQFVGTQTLWDQFVFGAGVWLGSSKNLAVSEIPWSFPIVFDRMAIQITVVAAAGVRLGNVLIDIDELSYTAQPP